MVHYLRILRLFWSASLAAELEYRVQFLVASLASVMSISGAIFTFYLLFRTGGTAGVGGWDWHQAMLVLGMFTMLDGMSSTLLSPNLSRIVQHVQMGTLDFVLLKPVDSQFWVSLRTFSPWGLPNIVLGAALLVYAGWSLELRAINLVAGLGPVLLGVLVLYSLWFIVAAMSIWFVKVYNATEVLRNLLEAGRYPLAWYPLPWQFVFTFVIPVAFLTTVPAEAILGRAETSWLISGAALAVGLFLFARYFWRFALRYYTSASS
ncbi:MAG: ABC transporter permease [Phycisphaeraceae bacterium]